MQEVLRYIEQRTAEQRDSALISWLSDDSVPARDRLVRWLPCAAPWVFGFMDLNGVLLRYPDDEAAHDPRKRAINAHLEEDADHWRFYVDDLRQLGLDAAMRFPDTLRFLWGEETRRQRMAVYRLSALAARATDPKLRYTLILALESMAHLVFETLRRVSEPYGETTGVELIYIASEHADREPGHLTRQVDGVEAALQAEELDPASRQEALDIAAEVCDAVADRWAEMHRFGQSERYRRFLRSA